MKYVQSGQNSQTSCQVIVTAPCLSHMQVNSCGWTGVWKEKALVRQVKSTILVFSCAMV